MWFAAAADSLCCLTQFWITRISVYRMSRAYLTGPRSLHSDIIQDRSFSLSFPVYWTMSWMIMGCFYPISHLIPFANPQKTMAALEYWYLTNSSFHADTTSLWNGELLFWVDVVGSLWRPIHPIIVTTLAAYKSNLHNKKHDLLMTVIAISHCQHYFINVNNNLSHYFKGTCLDHTMVILRPTNSRKMYTN